MEVIKISPRGYCYGVVDALQLVRQTAKDPTVPRPIYIIGQIVHNRHAIEELTNLGVITLEGPDRASILEQVNEGTVIFTAHGVSPLVKHRAREHGLNCIDATCPDVTVTHDLVHELAANGYYILYIGKKGHPEPEGVLQGSGFDDCRRRSPQQQHQPSRTGIRRTGRCASSTYRGSLATEPRVVGGEKARRGHRRCLDSQPVDTRGDPLH